MTVMSPSPDCGGNCGEERFGGHWLFELGYHRSANAPTLLFINLISAQQDNGRKFRESREQGEAIKARHLEVEHHGLKSHDAEQDQGIFAMSDLKDAVPGGAEDAAHRGPRWGVVIADQHGNCVGIGLGSR